MNKILLSKDKNFIKVTAAVLVLILLSVFGGIFPKPNIKNAEAKTIVKSWTFEDGDSHLKYEVNEYKDGTFAIKEYYFGSISRYITGRAYIDRVNGRMWAKAWVDKGTRDFWDTVLSNRSKRDNIDAFIGTINILTFVYPETFADYIREGVKSILYGAKTFIGNNNGLANDTERTIYEISCSSQAAWDLMENPGVILPSVYKPKE